MEYEMRISDWSSDVCSSALAHTAQQRAEVVARLARVQQLAEHLDARADRLLGIADAHDLDLVANLHDAALDAPGHHRAAPRDREHVLDRHQERLVLRSEEHTSELQSLMRISYAVFCLKKKTKNNTI